MIDDDSADLGREARRLRAPLYTLDHGANIVTPDGRLIDLDEFMARARRPRLSTAERIEKARRHAELFQVQRRLTDVELEYFGESLPSDVSALDEPPDRGSAA